MVCDVYGNAAKYTSGATFDGTHELARWTGRKLDGPPRQILALRNHSLHDAVLAIESVV